MYVYIYILICTSIHVCAYLQPQIPDGGTALFSHAWKCLVGLRIRSRGSKMFNSFLLLLIVGPPNTYVLRNQCCLHTRSRLEPKRDLGEAALV